MQIILSKTAEELGKKAAEHTAKLINDAIKNKGSARIILSTGASQFTTIEALCRQSVDWSRVEMFHLDEYIDLPLTHPASFVKYLRERFVDKLPCALKAVHFVDTSIGAEKIMEQLSEELCKAPVDVGLIGIGENAHIAFNDPPADFECKSCYKVVTLDEACRKQQFGEGWFSSFDAVPKQALSMTVDRILKCENIISAVPYAVKAKAVHDTLTAEKVTNLIPATILSTHKSAFIYIDTGSASMLPGNMLMALT